MRVGLAPEVLRPFLEAVVAQPVALAVVEDPDGLVDRPVDLELRRGGSVVEKEALSNDDAVL